MSARFKITDEMIEASTLAMLECAPFPVPPETEAPEQWREFRRAVRAGLVAAARAALRGEAG